MTSSATSRPCRVTESDPYRVHDPAAIADQLASLSPEQREGFWKLYRTGQSRLTDLEMKQARELVGLFTDAAKEIEVSISRAVGKGENWDLASMRRLGRDQVLFKQIQDRIARLGGEFRTVLDENALQSYKASYLDNAYRLDKLTPESMKVAFGILPDREILSLLNQPFSGARFSDRLGLITDDMAHKIQQELTRSMINEENWRQAAARIRDEMGTQGQKAYWRSEMVARTELARAQEMAAQQVFAENADIIDKVVWLAHPGACEKCTALHGTELKSPEDYPPQASHPNCVCDAVAIPKPFEELAAGADDKLPPRQSLAAWSEETGVSAAVGGTD